MQDWIGKTQTQSERVTLDKLARFCAVFDNTPQKIPAGFHFTLCAPQNPTDELGADGHPKKGGFLPPIKLPRRMWVGSKINFHAPLEMEAEIERVSKIISIEEKSGKQGELVFVSVEHSWQQNGSLVIDETQTLVYREAASQKADLPSVTENVKPLEESIFHEVLTPDEVLLFRYSALTFNAHRIHYDRPYAENEENYPALVVHGPLMASLVLNMAERQFGVARYFEFRAKAPAFCGQPLYVDFVPRDDGHGFLLRGGDGRDIMEGFLR